MCREQELVERGSGTEQANNLIRLTFIQDSFSAQLIPVVRLGVSLKKPTILFLHLVHDIANYRCLSDLRLFTNVLIDG
jgi:hypothetical protein